MFEQEKPPPPSADADAESAAESAATGRGSNGRFQKGNPGHRLRREAAARVGEAVREPPRLLRAMRFVTNNPETKDRSQLQRHCRLWLKEDRADFLKTLASLEKAVVAGRARGPREDGPGAGNPAGELPTGPQDEKVEELCNRLLSEAAWDADQERAECAALAARMGAGQAVIDAIRNRTWGPNAA